MSDPGWLTVLKAAREADGRLSYRALAIKTGVPHSTIGNTFSGTVRPNRETLLQIVNGICDEAGAEVIMEKFDESALEYGRGLPRSTLHRADHTDAIRELAGAIVYLADAITGHNRPLP